MDDSNLRAEWHLADLLNSGGSDPFGTTFYTSGITVDLTANEEELAAALVGLLYREQSLFSRDVTCHWKDDGQDCMTCPHTTLDPTERRSQLCRLGKDQSLLEARYLELTRQREGCDELATAVDAASELGHLPDELAELLTAVGL